MVADDALFMRAVSVGSVWICNVPEKYGYVKKH